MAEDFLKRASRFCPVEMREIRPGRPDLWSRPARKVLLDAAGKSMDSRQFTSFIANAEMEGRDLAFVVGGAEGHPQGWRERADLLLALSPMTYAHELARVMLAEQIYRAFATLRGHPYPR